MSLNVAGDAQEETMVLNQPIRMAVGCVDMPKNILHKRTQIYYLFYMKLIITTSKFTDVVNKKTKLKSLHLPYNFGFPVYEVKCEPCLCLTTKYILIGGLNH